MGKNNGNLAQNVGNPETVMGSSVFESNDVRESIPLSTIPKPNESKAKHHHATQKNIQTMDRTKRR